MTPKEITDFLNRVDPPLLGVLGTIDPQGFPHLVPVWYHYDGQVVTIWTTLQRAWPKYLQRDPRVSLSVQETEPPFAAVLLKGHAEIVVEGDEHSTQVRRIVERYIASDEIDSYIEPWKSLEAMCVIRPVKFVAWKRGY